MENPDLVEREKLYRKEYNKKIWLELIEGKETFMIKIKEKSSKSIGRTEKKLMKSKGTIIGSIEKKIMKEGEIYMGERDNRN